ncbi:MAG: Unknown protein [uncultured Sulfurovum sp.]|uniref:DUF4178 domain-containing protein n=1 Tax=uncultured Sulfurovum sp. TaxID=269237 RepID=A0A6S6TVX0_9BACT|nr:MAG: Unknown protein [uncultured Sulfurovum sp.]
MHQVKSIKCTNCAAPLDLLGGGRVESITCAYCNSVLDLNDHYKVLSNFKNVRGRQKLPFKVGMQGKLKGIDYTIIGLISYVDTKYSSSTWTDFLLFSPLYGYAYLTYENGHLIYSKRNRTFPNFTWSELANHSIISVDGRAYKPFDKYDAKVTYVEGELTWIAKRHERTSFIDLIHPPFGISVEKTKSEVEYYLSEYLDSTMVYEAFNMEVQEKPQSFNVLKPFERPFLKSLSYIAYWVLFIVALLALAIYFDGSGTIIKNSSADNKAVQYDKFRINTNRYLVDLELRATTAKELNNFNLQIHKDKKIIFSLTPSSAYVFDSDTNSIQKKLHPWDKGSKKVRVSLNLEELGIYNLSVKPIDPKTKSTLFITIKEASSRLNYLVWFFIISIALWLVYKFYKWRYNLKVEEEKGDFVAHHTQENKGSHTLMIVLSIIFIAIIIAFGD